MKKIKIALDWTANTNHTGFFVAQDKGFYQELGLDVTILTPDMDNYQTTPAKKVELGEADFALCPMESIISYQTKTNPFKLIAAATIFKEDLSAIAVLRESGIHSPKDLDGKIYASYQARYEDSIVRQMIKNAGGEGEIKITYPQKLGIWETILQKQTDATWIFLNWEGVQAEEKGIDLRLFKMKDYGIPYSYSPVIALGKERMSTHLQSYKDFITATKSGFVFAKNNPLEAAELLKKYLTKEDLEYDIVKIQAYTSAHYAEEKSWGEMDRGEVELFLKWLAENGLESQDLRVENLITDRLL